MGNTGEKPIEYTDEWKTSVETSQKFDDMLVDLRKYGFSILTGLITAGSFLGFSAKDVPEFTYANIIHLGVINVSMLLVLILFWLDVYYQNLLYGSVLRTRFLESCRLKFKLSIFISGIYTGSGLGISGMANVLYFIYIAFLLGTFGLGLIVATSSEKSDATIGEKINHILLLLIGLVPSGLGMLVIGIVSIRSRDKRLTDIVREINKTMYEITKEGIIKKEKQPPPTKQDIDNLELWIIQRFQARV